MRTTAESVDKLISQLSRLPGIGPKSAARLAFHILKLSREEAEDIIDAIRTVKDKVGFCSICWNVSETDPCRVCTDPKRRQDVICVVEEAADASAMDRAEGYNGVYHILGGRLSPLNGVGPDDLHIRDLMTRMSGEVSEIIIATNPTVEGEATATYLARLLKPMGIKVTRIARGLPVGSDLEYADSVTLSRALEGRQEF